MASRRMIQRCARLWEEMQADINVFLNWNHDYDLILHEGRVAVLATQQTPRREHAEHKRRHKRAYTIL